MTSAILTKISTRPEGKVSPFGARGLGPITDGYIAKGTFETMPIIGQSFVLNRAESQGIVAAGVMITSPVQYVWREPTGYLFRTSNSTYRLTVQT